MTHDQSEILRRFHTVLVREIQTNNPDYLSGPFSVAEIYQNLVPYRTHRDQIGVEMNADYEHALLQLLAGEGDFLTIESRTARQEIREELDSANPNTGLYRDFAAADVRLNPDKVDDALRGWEGPIAVLDDEEEEMEDLPVVPEGLPGLDGEGEESEMEVEALISQEVEEEEKEVGEVDSPALPFELSDQEEVLPMDSASLEEDDVVDEEPSPAGPGSHSPETCPWCREKMPDREGVKFCPFCGSNVLLVPCPECGEELESNWRFCVTCGTEVSS